MSSEQGVIRRPLLGILTLAVTLLVAVSALTSPPWSGGRPFPGMPAHACGTVGLLTAEMLLGGLGVPLCVAVVLLGTVLGLRFIFGRPPRPWLFLTWFTATALSLSIFGGGIWHDPPWGSVPIKIAGAIGSSSFLGRVGAPIAVGALVVGLVAAGFLRWVPSEIRGRAGHVAAAVIGLARAALIAAGATIGRGILTGLKAMWEQAQAWRRQRRAARAARDATRRAAARPATTPSPRPGPYVVEPIREEEVVRPVETAAGPVPRTPTHLQESFAPGPGDIEGGDEDPSSLEGAAAPGVEPVAAESGGSSPAGSGIRPTRKNRVAREAAAAGAAAWQGAGGDYVLPPVELLETGDPPPPVDRDELLETSRILVQTLRDFGIQGQVGQIHPGPVVTQYEFEPAAGVKISQIVSRADDLALALRVSRVRLVAPIPGKAAVGIEAPNRAPARISLRPVLHELESVGLSGELPLVFGRDIRGRAFFSRLEQMPHLLVAGTTGSGKSVFLNCVLLSLLLRKTPNDLRLLLIDPKMLELTPYDGIPHLACPVVTEAKIAARMLTWAVGEMERRYRRLAAVGVRSLEGYRQKARTSQGEAAGLEPMPHIVIIVDELADLMLTVANEVEGPIARLAQMARAVGLHLVLATQRPSVDVITGVIKANFPARVGFQVASKVDSRTILDTNGAESLLGRGDMLFIPPGKAEAVRVHGAFVSDRDTEAVAAFWREQPPAPELIPEDGLEGTMGDPEMEDELFEDALRLVILQRQASTSFLQRRLKVGYSRAGRLMDLLEQAGAVGPPEGSKPREVLADERFLEAWRHREGSDAANTLG